MATSSLTTIEGRWEEFRGAVVPANAPPILVREMKIAFFGGATALLAITKTIASADVSDLAGVHMFQALHEETAAFAAALVSNPKATP